MNYLKRCIALLSITLFISCESQEVKTKEIDKKEEIATLEFQNKGHELVYEMTQIAGNYQDLLNQKDIVFKYTYRTPSQQEDVSIESYVFDGELSHANYLKHERTMSQLKGNIQQGFNGSEAWLTLDGIEVTDSNLVASSLFTRKTNFYWFAMMQKLLDPGINYEYLGQDSAVAKLYDVVKITFESSDTLATDIYQLYINPKTHLVDQFLFTVVSKNVNDPILMRVEYENIQNILLTTYRKYTKSDWEATVIKDVWVEEISSDIKFNQGLDKSLFNK